MRTLLRPCYMPHPEGQCHPQTTTNLSAPCPRSVTSLPLPQQRGQRPRLGQLVEHITAQPDGLPTATALHSYRSTHTAFYHLASQGNPPNPWETCMHEGKPKHHKPFLCHFSRQIHHGRSGCEISTLPHCQVHQESVLLYLSSTESPTGRAGTS